MDGLRKTLILGKFGKEKKFFDLLECGKFSECHTNRNIVEKTANNENLYKYQKSKL